VFLGAAVLQLSGSFLSGSFLRARALLHSLVAAVWLQPFAFPFQAGGPQFSFALQPPSPGAFWSSAGRRLLHFLPVPSPPPVPFVFFSGVERLQLQLFFCHFFELSFLVLPGQL